MSYTDIFNQDPTLYGNTGMPTIDPGAAMGKLGTVDTGMGISPPSPITPPVAPTLGGQQAGGGMKAGFFSQYGPAQFGLSAIQTLGSLWNSFQQNKMAKQSFNFQKEAYQTNLENQTQSYNTELEDRINARYATEGRANAAADAASYVEKNRL
jgi:hypothetical protein